MGRDLAGSRVRADAPARHAPGQLASWYPGRHLVTLPSLPMLPTGRPRAADRLGGRVLGPGRLVRAVLGAPAAVCTAWAWGPVAWSPALTVCPTCTTCPGWRLVAPGQPIAWSLGYRARAPGLAGSAGHLVAWSPARLGLVGAWSPARLARTGPGWPVTWSPGRLVGAR